MILKIKKRENPYVQIDKSIVDDPKITWKAKGILIYLLAKPDDWEVYAADIVKHAIDGRDAVYSGLNELIAAGYIGRTDVRGEAGKFCGKIYEVHEIPIPPPAKPLKKRSTTIYGKSRYGKAVFGKSDTTNIYSNNIDSTNPPPPTPPTEEEEGVKELPHPFNALLPSQLVEAQRLCKLNNLNLQEQAEALKGLAKDNPTNYLLKVLRTGGFAGATEAAVKAREAEARRTVKKAADAVLRQAEEAEEKKALEKREWHREQARAVYEGLHLAAVQGGRP